MAKSIERGPGVGDDIQEVIGKEPEDLNPEAKETLELATQLKDKILELEKTKLKEGEKISKLMVGSWVREDSGTFQRDWELDNGGYYEQSENKQRHIRLTNRSFNHRLNIDGTIGEADETDLSIYYDPDGGFEVSMRQEIFAGKSSTGTNVVGVGPHIEKGNPKHISGILKHIMGGLNGIKIEREEKV